jgi:hypothetical protein
MIQDLDKYFPFIVLIYGMIMTIATHLPLLKQKLREGDNQELLQWFYSHQILGLVCVLVGGLWSLQRLVITLFL